MKSFQLLISFFLIINLNFSLSAQQFFNSSDTLEVIASGYDQLLIKHKVELNQSIESIALHYGIDKYDLFEINPLLQEETKISNATILIPLPLESLRKLSPAFGADSLYHTLLYTVKAGENLYHISNRLFRQSMDSIQVRNKLDELNVAEGQIIHIGWLAKFGIPPTLQTKRLKIQLKQNQINQAIYKKQISNKELLNTDQGSAIKMTENKSKDLVCLHRDLEKGKIIRILNPMNDRVLYLKVMGPIPQHLDPKVKLVTTQYVAKLLGVLDDSFYIKTQY